MDIPPSIALHHEWINNPKLKYMDGEVKLFNDLPVDIDVNYLEVIMGRTASKKIVH